MRANHLLKFLLPAVLAMAACEKSKDLPPLSNPPEAKAQTNPEYERKLELAMNAIEQSPLGAAYREFLFSELSPEDENRFSHHLMDLIFKDSPSAITATSAIQLLNERYNQQGRLGPLQLKRLALVNADLRQRQLDEASYPGEGLAYLAAAAFLASLPMGYPPIRTGLKMGIRKFSRWMAPVVRSRRLAQVYADLPPLWKDWKTYQVTRALHTFFDYFGPFTLVYFYWFDWKESARGHSIPTRIESYTTPASFNHFLEDMRRL